MAMPPNDPVPAPTPEALAGAFRRLLRPFVRLLIRGGITFPAFAELARALYVDVAGRDLLSDSAERTDSRLSLMTGVHRKEIRRLREQRSDDPPAPSALPPAAAVIARWLGQHVASDGSPLPLPRASDEAGSFDDLVRAVTTDVRPRAVLDEMLSRGVVSLDADDRVHLAAAAFLPQPGAAEQLFYFGRNLRDHAAAATANILARGDAPFFDRSAHYDRLTPETAASLERIGRDAAQRMLIEVNRAAQALLEANDAAVAADPGQPLLRVNIGAYVLRDQDAAEGWDERPVG